MVSENTVITFKGIKTERLNEIISGISKVKIALIGDLCLDIYWRADMTQSELSRETPHFPLPIVEEWMSPGAGGNVASNIAELTPGEIYTIGIVGRDWRGDCLIHEFRKRNIDTKNILVSNDRITNAYCKPLRRGISALEYEDPRLDFCNFDNIPVDDEESLKDLLEQTASKVDILCVSDQFTYGCITKGIRDKINKLAGQGLKVVVDSRDRIGMYTDVILKPNEIEGFRAVWGDEDTYKGTFEELANTAKILAERNHSRVCMTMGSKGCIYYENSLSAFYIPSYEVKPPLDTVGAGDCFLAAFSCAVAAGAKEYEAAAFANMAADVIIKKVGTTGTASPDEIRKRHNEIFGS